MLATLKGRCNAFLQRYAKTQNYIDYWRNGYNRREIHGLSSELEHTVDYLANSRDKMVIIKLMDMPILRSLWLYHPTNYGWLGYLVAVVFPIGLPLYLAGTRSQRKFKDEIRLICSVADEITTLLNKNTLS